MSFFESMKPYLVVAAGLCAIAVVVLSTVWAAVALGRTVDVWGQKPTPEIKATARVVARPDETVSLLPQMSALTLVCTTALGKQAEIKAMIDERMPTKIKERPKRGYKVEGGAFGTPSR